MLISLSGVLSKMVGFYNSTNGDVIKCFLADQENVTEEDENSKDQFDSLILSRSAWLRCNNKVQLNNRKSHQEN